MKQFFSIYFFKDHNDTCPIKALDEIRDVLLSTIVCQAQQYTATAYMCIAMHDVVVSEEIRINAAAQLHTID